jgi:hypothetical protein
MNFKKIMFRMVYTKLFLRDGDQNEHRNVLHFFLMDLVVVVVATHSVTIPAKSVSDWLYIYLLRAGQPISAEISP